MKEVILDRRNVATAVPPGELQLPQYLLSAFIRLHLRCLLLPLQCHPQPVCDRRRHVVLRLCLLETALMKKLHA